MDPAPEARLVFGPMFDSLTDKLQRVFKNLRGEGKLTEANMQEALREIRLALLEADVNFKVVKQLLDGIKEKALGQDVLSAFSPTEQVVQIVRDELVRLLGGVHAKLRFANDPPSVFLIAGLQGSGKTTSTGKLALWLSRNGHRPLMVSVDIYRPAARRQLSVIAQTVKLPIYEGAAEQAAPLELASGARREAAQTGRDVVLVDTAGRLHIDDALMQELEQLRGALHPTEILYVADAMTGQDAVRSGEEFHRRLGITGVILTKMDGDARGGAALSIRHVTGQPLKFIGVGEKFDALEPFHPDRIASRILGMGDVLSLVEKAQEAFSKEQAESFQKKLTSKTFTLEDFRDQIGQVNKLGSMDEILGMLPGGQRIKDLAGEGALPEKEIARTVAIISSMTPRERRDHTVLSGSRKKRIARGSGASVQDVNRLIKQFLGARTMMKAVSGGGGKRQLAQMLRSL